MIVRGKENLKFKKPFEVLVGVFKILFLFFLTVMITSEDKDVADLNWECIQGW